ncbi:MAG: hypothetical protein V3S30_01860 [Thermoanaerobaculia bacterium]
MESVHSIVEPTTMATDYILALLCALMASRLREKARETGSRAVVFWRWAFVATSVGAMAGGSAHGFALFLTDWQWAAIWKASTLMIGAASFCLLVGTSYARLGGGWGRAVRYMALLKVAVYVTWMIGHDDFRFVIFEYGSSMLLILGIESWRLLRDRSIGLTWIPAGILLSFVSSAVQQSELVLHRNFNQNDLFHVVQMEADFLLYRGGILLRDRRSGSAA